MICRVSEMTDRYDNLLLKARAEVLGKHTLRAEPSTDVVFEAVWDGLQKGLLGGAKRGWLLWVIQAHSNHQV